MKEFPLYKKEKLCSVVAIEQLFGRGGADFSRLAYPLRAVARNNPRRKSDAPVAFLISVPKKRLRHAVDRVRMRRLIREAYRLQKGAFPVAPGMRLDLAFVYVADSLKSYASVAEAMRRILSSLSTYYNESPQSDC